MASPELIGNKGYERLTEVFGPLWLIPLVTLYKNVPSVKNKPFIHLTFLDAYAPNPGEDTYGLLQDYRKQKHSAEHYVDRTPALACPDAVQRFLECGLARPLSSTCMAVFGTYEEARCALIASFTNKLLPNSFNVDITDWQPVTVEDKKDHGHQWPRYWYEKSVTSPGFKYGYPLSFEGRGKDLNELAKYPAGRCIKLKTRAQTSKCDK